MKLKIKKILKVFDDFLEMVIICEGSHQWLIIDLFFIDIDINIIDIDVILMSFWLSLFSVKIKNLLVEMFYILYNGQSCALIKLISILQNLWLIEIMKDKINLCIV